MHFDSDDESKWYEFVPQKKEKAMHQSVKEWWVGVPLPLGNVVTTQILHAFLFFFLCFFPGWWVESQYKLNRLSNTNGWRPILYISKRVEGTYVRTYFSSSTVGKHVQLIGFLRVHENIYPYIAGLSLWIEPQ